MTREEAITTLKKMHDTFDEIHESTNGEIGYEQMTAIDMAIEALMHDRRNMNKTDAAQILQKYVFDDGECIAQDMKDYNEALKMAIESLSAKAIFEQIKWERDVALQTLEEHGIGLGQKADCGARMKEENNENGTL